jgi:hypothetical protein
MKATYHRKTYHYEQGLAILTDTAEVDVDTPGAGGLDCPPVLCLTIHEVEALASRLGVPLYATSDTVGATYCGDGWWSEAIVDHVHGRLRLPTCLHNQTHAVYGLKWNPNTGNVAALCQWCDATGRLLNERRRLDRRDDGACKRGKLIDATAVENSFAEWVSQYGEPRD